MKYLKLFDSPVKHNYSIDDGGDVKFGNGRTKREEIRKFKVIQKYLEVDSVCGSVDEDEIDLSFGYGSKNKRGQVVGMDVIFEIHGDRFQLNWVYVGYDHEKKEVSSEGNGPDLIFKINYCPVKDGKFDMAAFKETIKDLKSWIDDPEFYTMVNKYNL